MLVQGMTTRGSWKRKSPAGSSGRGPVGIWAAEAGDELHVDSTGARENKHETNRFQITIAGLLVSEKIYVRRWGTRTWWFTL